MKFGILVITFFFATLIGCKNNPVNPVQSNINEFSGITITGSDSPVPIGEIDTTDWSNDINWGYMDLYQKNIDSIKISRFDTLSSIITKPVSFKVFPAFCNPTFSNFELRFNCPCYSKVFIVVIDNNFNILSRVLLETLNSGFFTTHINLVDKIGIPLSPGIYRCIYRFEDIETGKFGVYNGHGDVQVIKY